jgi:stearoyl-CoA desaturase (delta-9 desaturase)
MNPADSLLLPERPSLETAVDERPVEESLEGPTPEEIQEPVLENLDRFVTGLITVVPLALVVLAGWQLWNRELHWRDIVIFLIMYIPIGLGVTVGFHRMLTHRSFKTSPWLRGLFAILGTMSVEGPVISWVADHRKHHAYSDRLGDPHSPHVDSGGGWQGALRGLAHAHVGWLFDHTQRGSRERFASSCCTTSLTASTRCVTSSVAGGSPPAITRTTSRGWRRCPLARRGTTTTTHSRPLPSTV